jgi:hypothetical protein
MDLSTIINTARRHHANGPLEVVAPKSHATKGNHDNNARNAPIARKKSPASANEMQKFDAAMK